jgi:hypothetical protein
MNTNESSFSPADRLLQTLRLEQNPVLAVD